MEKPTVFLSHSSKDKAPLAALKTMLDERAAGSLDFFLSSDGESIRFGSNWVVRISDALSNAKLMFLFLSPVSADSNWIHFEAGCAYAKGIQVVPVCLPGIDLNQIRAPLNHLQGFNLHSHESMGNLARICNEVFEMKIKEVFIREDFERIASASGAKDPSIFGVMASAIDEIKLSDRNQLPNDDFNPVEELLKVSKSAGMDCHSWTKGELSKNGFENHLEQPGCIVRYGLSHLTGPHRYDRDPATVIRKEYEITITLSPELLHTNSHVLDQWQSTCPLSGQCSLQVWLRSGIVVESQRHRLTTKLFQHGIQLKDRDIFRFEGLDFEIATHSISNRCCLLFRGFKKLDDSRLPRLVERLFDAGVFWEKVTDYSELVEG